MPRFFILSSINFFFSVLGRLKQIRERKEVRYITMLTIAGKKTSTVSMLVLKLSSGCIRAEITSGVKAMAEGRRCRGIGYAKWVHSIQRAENLSEGQIRQRATMQRHQLAHIFG